MRVAIALASFCYGSTFVSEPLIQCGPVERQSMNAVNCVPQILPRLAPTVKKIKTPFNGAGGGALRISTAKCFLSLVQL